MAFTYSKYITCHECDLVVSIPIIPKNHRAHCPRCDYTLISHHDNALDRMLALILSALVFIGLALGFPFIGIEAQGLTHNITLMETVITLVSGRPESLAIATIIFFFILLMPLSYLLSLLYVLIAIKCDRKLPAIKPILKLLDHFKAWSMAEIFLISILISFIKILSLASVSLEISFWAYIVFTLLFLATTLHFDQLFIWQHIARLGKTSNFAQHQTTSLSLIKSKKVNTCHVCTTHIDIHITHCPLCKTPSHTYSGSSLQTSLALLVTAFLLYIPANLLPVMQTQFLGDITQSTILEGVILLWQHGSYPIAIIIFIASIMVPTGKLIALAWLCYTTANNRQEKLKHRTRLYRLTEFIGRWSMVDVFVVAILAALIDLGSITNIVPDWGILAFAGMVISSMLAASYFDPRLIWNQQRAPV